jgi:hypothetical protein
MRFRQFYLLVENDPMGNAGAPPAGGPPMGGAPPGGPLPMSDPMGGMSGPPGMGAPLSATGVSSNEPPAVPKNANVWDVLDSILNNKPLEHEKQKQQQQQKQSMGRNIGNLSSVGGSSDLGGSPMGGPPMGLPNGAMSSVSSVPLMV